MLVCIGWRDQEAVKAVAVSDTEIFNPSNVDLYIKIDGESKILPANSRITL